MSNQLETITSALEIYTGKPAKRSGDSVKLVCTHDGATHYNLSAKDGNDRVLLYCHSQHCDPADILSRAGLDIADIYHQQLTPDKARQHKAIVNDREIRSALEVELMIIFQWLSASNEVLFPCDEEVQPERVMQAFKLALNGCNHYIKEGIQ